MSGLALADRERWRDRGQLKRGAESPRSDGATTGKTLSDLGISKDQSSRWQKLAQVPADEFEATFAGESKPSTGGIIGKHAKKNAVNDDALWLWPIGFRTQWSARSRPKRNMRGHARSYERSCPRTRASRREMATNTRPVSAIWISRDRCRDELNRDRARARTGL